MDERFRELERKVATLEEISRALALRELGRFYEYVSPTTFFGLPLVHIAIGKDPATGRRRVAKGVIAIGRTAVGIIPIAQFAFGVIPIGQFAIGLLFALGQFSIASISVGQFAGGFVFALGQFATAPIAIGQFAFGYYAMGLRAAGKYVLDKVTNSPEAIDFFKELFPGLMSKLRGG